jgi:putative transcriptional regulator
MAISTESAILKVGHVLKELPMKTQDSESLKNHFLVAMPNLREGFFAQSITYICDHSKHGAMGIVINQPIDLSLYDIFEHLNIECSDKYNRVQVMAGGPVSLNQGFVLHRSNQQRWQATVQITADVNLTSSQDILHDIATGKGPNDCLVALGYAGWGAGQLESEMAENSWLTLPASSHIIFDTDVEQRLPLAVKSLGIDMNLMSSEAGHA